MALCRPARHKTAVVVSLQDLGDVAPHQHHHGVCRRNGVGGDCNRHPDQTRKHPARRRHRAGHGVCAAKGRGGGGKTQTAVSLKNRPAPTAVSLKIDRPNLERGRDGQEPGDDAACNQQSAVWRFKGGNVDLDCNACRVTHRPHKLDLAIGGD